MPDRVQVPERLAATGIPHVDALVMLENLGRRLTQQNRCWLIEAVTPETEEVGGTYTVRLLRINYLQDGPLAGQIGPATPDGYLDVCQLPDGTFAIYEPDPTKPLGYFRFDHLCTADEIDDVAK